MQTPKHRLFSAAFVWMSRKTHFFPVTAPTTPCMRTISLHDQRLAAMCVRVHEWVYFPTELCVHWCSTLYFIIIGQVNTHFIISFICDGYGVTWTGFRCHLTLFMTHSIYKEILVHEKQFVPFKCDGWNILYFMQWVNFLRKICDF